MSKNTPTPTMWECKEHGWHPEINLCPWCQMRDLRASNAGLLEALEELVHQVEISNAVDDLGHRLRNLRAMGNARAAIAKAKGE